MSAKEFATSLHQNDTWGQFPYSEYLRQVAKKASQLGLFNNAKIDNLVDSSWLHDTLETHPEVNYETLSRFNMYKDTLCLLTRKSGETYTDYIQRIVDSENKEAQLVKVADLMMNNETASESLKKRYKNALQRLTPLIEMPV